MRLPADFVHISCDDSEGLGPWAFPLFYCFLKSVSLCSCVQQVQGQPDRADPGSWFVNVRRVDAKQTAEQGA